MMDSGSSPYPPLNQFGSNPYQQGQQFTPSQVNPGQYQPPNSGYTSSQGGQGYPVQGSPYPPTNPGYPQASEGSGYPPQQTNPAMYPQASTGNYQPSQPYPPSQGFQGYPPQQGAMQQQQGFVLNQDTVTNGPANPATNAGFNPPPPDFRGEVLDFDPKPQLPFNPFFVPNFDDPAQIQSGATDPSQFKAVEISSDEARRALEAFASKKWCYGKPTDIELKEITMQSILKYRLLTLTEARKTQWAFEAYENQTLPGPCPVPNAWEIQVSPTKDFEKEDKKIQIPGTTSVRPCQKCWGSGRGKCTHCDGMGKTNCTWCNGTGQKTIGSGDPETCTSCSGMGRKSCTFCHGHGSKQCGQCKGRGSVFTYLQLIVEWDVHEMEHLTKLKDHGSGMEPIPDKKLSACKSVPCFEETRDRLYPLYSFPNEEIQKESRSLLEKAGALQTNDTKITKQKHSVDTIRIAAVNYKCKEESGSFYVFGEDFKVFFPNYPHKGCCTIC